MGQTQGRELPYDIGERFTSLTSKTIWSVHAGKKKAGGDTVTVFVFDFTNRSQEEIKLAQSAHLRLKTLRHPNILKYIDGIELPTCIYVVTEEAVPLENYIATKDGSSSFSIAWGLHQVIKSISFFSNDCSLIHRNICLSSVFVDEAGEWKLAGVEFMHSHGETYVSPKHLEQLFKYDPPEISKSGAARRTEKWSTDMWGLGCLVWEVFNGTLPQSSSLKNTSKIPNPLIPHYCEMVSANPRSRPNPLVLLERLREHGGFLADNFVSIALKIEEVQILEPSQRNDFFNELNKNLDSFPESFSKHKILPQLINAFEFGGAGSSILAPLFKLGGLLKGEQYQKKIVPCVVKLFSSTDRATRLNLLQQLSHFVDHLLPATVNDQIFPHIANGFCDTVPAIREQTVKSTVLLAPKLSSSILNGQLLKYLSKCQLDEQPTIRTNTNICLGKIAGYLSPSTRQKVLVTAFLRALKDPFPQARIAAIGSIGATHSYYSVSDLSSRLLPTLCTITVDKEKAVRDQAFLTIKFFLAKLEKISEDPQAAAEQEKIDAAAVSWTGWAVSSLTSKFYKSPQSQALPTSSGSVTTTKSMVEERQKEAKVATEEEDPVRGKGSDSRNRGIRSEDHEGIGSGREKLEVDHSIDDGEWQDEGWEDFNFNGEDSKGKSHTQSTSWDSGEVEAKEDSDMEGWEDDGWGTFDFPQPDTMAKSPSQQQPKVSSGADFFDNLSTNVPASSQIKKDRNPFDDFWISSLQPGKNERALPPLTPASLFSKSGASGQSMAVKSDTDIGGEGWGDWEEEFDVVKPAVKKMEKETVQSGMKLGNKQQSKGSSSWDFGDSSWDAFDSQSKNTGMESGGQSRQEILQKKREERRLKQQVAREKRAAGASLKPGGLGILKKD